MKDFQTIYLGLNEDISAVIEHLETAKSQDVILVIPKHAEIFSSIVNLKLLKREAENLGKQLVITTTDNTGRYLVQKAGIELLNERDFELIANEENNYSAGIAEQEGTMVYEDRDASQEMVVASRGKIMADIVSPEKRIVHLKVKTSEIDALKKKTDKKLEAKPEPVLPVFEKPAAPKAAIPKIAKKEETFEKEIYLREEKIIEPKHVPAELIEEKESILKRQAEKHQIKIDEMLEKFQPARKEQIATVSKKRFSPKKLKKIFWSFAGISVLVALTSAFFVFPEATLSVEPKVESSELVINLIADKNISAIDLSQNKIPAQLVKIEKKDTQEFSTTGERTNDERAKGIISIYNAYSSSPQTIVRTTRFVSVSTGKVFRTTQAVTIPGAKVENGVITPNHIDIEVIADQPGPDYNIGPGDFKIPGFEGSSKYEGFYGKSKSAMSEGSLGKTKVVLQADLDSAATRMLNGIKDKIEQALEDQLPENYVLLEGALKEEEPEITFSHSAGDPAEKFSAALKIEDTAIVFDVKYLNELVDKSIASASSESFAEKEIVPGSQTIAYEQTQISFDKGQIKTNLKVKQDLVWKINQENIKNQLAGKDEIEIRKALSRMPEIKNAKVIFWPFWISKVPKQIDRIKIEVGGYVE